MENDVVIYTDGHDVTVTDSTLKVKNTRYDLQGITRHGLFVIRPERLPGIILLLLGLILGAVGFLRLLPPAAVPDVEVNNTYLDANTLALWIGALLVLIGILAIALVKQRYAVRIATAEGEKNAVVSNKREYIAQIVDALNEAYKRLNPPGSVYS